jgi:hypothetical protein
MAGHGGRRPGSGRPKGSPGLKSEALASRLDEMGCDPAEALVRLGNRAEAAGDTELAIKAFTALMPFRWPKLKESSIGLGLDGSFADQLAAAEGRLRITVVSGIDRPPDDPGAIEPDPVPKPPPVSPSAPESTPQPSASPAPPRPKPRPAAPPPPPTPAPAPPAAGGVMSAHAYWSQKREPEVKPLTDYDPWEMK